MDTIRERFVRVAAGMLDTDPRVAVLLADITADACAGGQEAAS